MNANERKCRFELGLLSFIRVHSRSFAALFCFLLLSATVRAADADPRQVLALDGAWEIAEGALDQPPAKFDHRVAVPGLVDLATPAFADVGVEASKPHRQAFWYRRTFTVDRPVPAAATLKIHKALFGTRVYLNGKLAGEHLPCFTPALLDVKDLLKPGDNELLIRVGAWKDALPAGIPYGFDFEKVRYIPGIYDSVELLLSGTPDVVRVQAVPEIEAKTVRVVVTVRNRGAAAAPTQVKCIVREATSGTVAGRADAPAVTLAAGQESTIELRLPLANCRLWSPEDPFLYDLEVSTGADTLHTRFGMRSFRFDPQTGRAILNGQPYFLRGTNVCIFRFFEDPAHAKAWDADWVRQLHRQFKFMHWNSCRYCIGFPPEAWYRIADEEGILIQDEFPIWSLGDKNRGTELTKDELVREYSEWMRERWNHPCVAIWDAQNETTHQLTGEALSAVRELDLSHRPWDNGWGAPQDPGDCREAHPYLASNPGFRLAQIARANPRPGLAGQQKDGPNAIVINEYGWLWTNRDGTPTTLSQKFYDGLLGPGAPPDAVFRTYARYLAAKTEFWRSGRQCAGVLHFCGLTYSRKGGQTCDNFADVEKLTFERYFQQYVRDAFAPVGLMIDYWAGEWDEGAPWKIPVAVINDQYQDWSGKVTLRLERDGQAVEALEQPCSVPALGRAVVTLEGKAGAAPGKYQLVAELTGFDGQPVRSLRDVEVLNAAERKARLGLAVGKPVTASSNLVRAGATSPEAAVDGNPATRWSSEFADPQWLAVDLGQPTKISRVELAWEGAYAKAYQIQVSPDGKNWQDVYRTDAGKGGTETIRFAPAEARFVRFYGTKRATEYGYSLWEFRVFP